MPTATTDARFTADVLESDPVVAVHFWAVWSGPCRLMDPILVELEREYPSLRFLKLNVDENPATPRNYQILQVPTLIFFRAGEADRTIVGAKPKAALVKELEAYL